jgi:glutamate-1-semialdehyde aminotransferase
LTHNDQLATGGTLFANPLSMIAARVTLESLLTEPNQERTAKLGGHLADGMERIFDHYEQDWSVHRFNRIKNGAKSNFIFLTGSTSLRKNASLRQAGCTGCRHTKQKISC